jgi:CubicO group peptidase (beta-lactamase class C family)
VRHLLTHTSGIQNHVAVPDYMDIFKTSAVGKEYPSREALIQEFYKLPSEFAPGETWSYDNTGYYLLGIIVERASGRSYWQFLDERIFKPLGMSATRSTDARAIVPNRAAGYQWVENRFENRPVLAPFIGYSAGSLLSSVEDLARWDAALYAEKILKKSSLDEMWAPTRAANGAAAAFDYGFGWFIEKYGARRDLHHSGGTIGFSSVIHRFVDDRLTVIILTNHADRMIDQMAFHIAGVYEPKLKRAEGRADPEPDTTLRLKKVMSDLLGAGSAETALLTRELQLHLKSATGKSLWQWYASLGALGAFTFSDREKTNGGGSVVRYKVLLGGNPYWFSFRLKDDGRIAQIYWW